MTQTNFEYSKTLVTAEREKFLQEGFDQISTAEFPLARFAIWLNGNHEGRFHTAINCLRTAKAMAKREVDIENVRNGGLYSSVLFSGLIKKNKEIDDAIKTLEAIEEAK